MVNIVKTIESTIKTDLRQMKFLKRQLKTNPSEINKLRQSTLVPERMIAPIHAAVQTENIEILQHILAMKDVYHGKLAIVRTCLNRNLEVGVIWLAVYENPKNLDILKLLLEHIQRPLVVMIEFPELGMLLPGCLVCAVENERLDIVELLLGKADILEREVNFGSLASFNGEVGKLFSLTYCLAIAVVANKPGLFRQLLLLPSFRVNDLYQLLPYKEKLVTLLDFAGIHKRLEMCKEMEQILADALTQARLDAERIADKIAHLMKSKKEKPCPKLENYKKRVVSHENDNLEGNECKEKNNNHEDETDTVVSRVKKLKYCWNCENISKYTCSGCRKARYCEEKCQWDDWESHKEYCLVRMNQIAFKEFEFLSASLFE